MEFSAKVLEAKRIHLDSILRRQDLLATVLRELFGDESPDIGLVPRPWEPGGGSTLFRVGAAGEEWFLKVKSTAVLVESKLERESQFPAVPALRNEFAILEQVKALGPSTPQRVRYVERDGFSFLFQERLAPLREAIAAMDAVQLLEVFLQLERTVRKIHAAGIVHTDIHEHNVVFRGGVPVLVDFEEARTLEQGVPFEASLDVIGANAWGDVGDMPAGDGVIPGRTCLARLRQVFIKEIVARLDGLVRECHFDGRCPYLGALDHGADDRIYQSIHLPGVLSVEGQRPVEDPRLAFLLSVADRLFAEPFTHLDIGSNLGRFNLELARSGRVSKTVGVEAHQPYVDLSRILAFLADARQAEFLRAECGVDRLHERLPDLHIDLVTAYSVYHHIANKGAFLEDLRALGPAHVLLEMAVQRECYEGRTWEQEVARICAATGMPRWQLLGRSEDYGRPIVLVSRALMSSETPRGSDGAPGVRRQPQPKAEAGGRPRVSVVLPVHNGFPYLPQAISSVLEQTFPELELIVVDDGSSDDSAAYVANLADARVRLIRHDRNLRLPQALNTGLAAARGALLTWTSADNCCAPAFLEALVAALDGHPDAGFAYSAFAWIDEQGRITGIHREQDFSYASLLSHNPGNASFLYRRSLYDTVGTYDAELEGAEDWDMWLRIRECSEPVYVPEILYYYRLHAKSMTATMPEAVRHAAERTFTKAIQRNGGILPLDAIYPDLQACCDRQRAQADACAHLGTKLAGSPWFNRQMGAFATSLLEQARVSPAIRGGATFNLAVCKGKLGAWHEAGGMVDELESREDAPRSGHLAQLKTAVAARDLQSLARVPLWTIDPHHSELFQREAVRRRVFSFTSQGGGARLAGGDTQGVSPQQQDGPDGGGEWATDPGYESDSPLRATPERVERAEHLGATVSPAHSPLVSVIIPTFNRPAMLRESVESVLRQTYKHWEVVVINDGGVDVTALLASFHAEDRVRSVSHQTNQGLAGARNSGLLAARGAFVAYLDDDDIFYPEHLATLVQALGSKGAVAYTDAYRAHQIRQGERYVVSQRDVPYSFDFDCDRILVENFIPVLCVMHARECVDQVGLFDPSLKRLEDWDLWIRMSRRFQFIHVPKITCEFRWRDDGSTMTSARGIGFTWATINILHKYIPLLGGKPALAERYRAIVRRGVHQLKSTLWADMAAGVKTPSESFCGGGQGEIILRLKFLRSAYPTEVSQLDELIALLHLENGDDAAVLAHLQAAVREDASNATAHQLLQALLGDRSGRLPGGAADAGQQAETLEAALAALDRQAWPEACEGFVHVLERDKQCAWARSGLGLGLIALGDSDEGLAQLREAVRLEPKPDFVCNLASGLIHVGQRAEGERLLRGILDLVPQHEAARANLEMLLAADETTRMSSASSGASLTAVGNVAGMSA